MYGREKWIGEPDRLKRWGYRLFGELHVPGRIRSSHIMREVRRMGLGERAVRVLDAGTGRGDLAIHLARLHPQWQILGIDVLPERIERAGQVSAQSGLRNVDFQTGRLEELAIRDEFDLIISADVLEHVEDDATVFSNLFRALRPGGVFLMTSPSVPQRKHLRLVRWRERRTGFKPSDYGHVRTGYGPRDLEERFRQAGGRMIRFRSTFGFFGTLAFDLFFVIGDNQPHPLIFAMLYPVLLVLGWLDLHWRSETGSAILAVGVRDAETGAL